MSAQFIDRSRASAAMAAAGLDALVLFQPEHVTWATGINPGPAALFRRAGAASVLIPLEPQAPMAVVLPDLVAAWIGAGAKQLDVAYHRTWVDTATAAPHDASTPLGSVLRAPTALPRPATFVPRAAFGLLREQLTARGLSRARLGVDLGFLPAADLAMLTAILPSAEIIDATDAIRRLRMVKTAAEIARLRTAVELSEAGLAAALAAIRPGIARDDLSRAYGHGAQAAAAQRRLPPPGLWDYISIGPDPWGAGRPAQHGDIIKLDVGAVVGGYSSDMARTVALGPPSRAARELHAALLTGLETGLGLLKPGVRLADVYAAMLGAVRRAGVPDYSRGHFGHGLGNDPFSEQWPFIAADSDVVAEPGMVLAVEAPHYVDGLGGFIVEDQVLVTAHEAEVMSRMGRKLAVHGA